MALPGGEAPHAQLLWNGSSRMIGRARARHLLVACGLLIGLTLACSAALVFIQLRQDDIVEFGTGAEKPRADYR